MSSDIKEAFALYRNGHKPWRDIQRNWFVIDETGQLYPAKYIWGLVVGESPMSFHTDTARRNLRKHGYQVLKLDDARRTMDSFEEKVLKSRRLSQKERRKRLQASARLPIKRTVATTVFDRNPDVVAEVLDRAKGVCENCLNPAPFLRKKDKTPFLEVHHIKTLAEGGEDTVDNACALCPNCHRELHFGWVLPRFHGRL